MVRLRDEALCVSPQNLVELRVVATRPRNENGLGLTTAQATNERCPGPFFPLRFGSPHPHPASPPIRPRLLVFEQVRISRIRTFRVPIYAFANFLDWGRPTYSKKPAG
jgi:hypothetical protein